MPKLLSFKARDEVLSINTVPGNKEDDTAKQDVDNSMVPFCTTVMTLASVSMT